MSTDKKEIRVEEIMNSIRQVLLKEWDPIGVKNEQEAQDEYDSYVSGVYSLLASNSSAEHIAEHLYKIENNQMGLDRRKIQDLLSIAQCLLSLDIQL